MNHRHLTSCVALPILMFASAAAAQATGGSAQGDTGGKSPSATKADAAAASPGAVIGEPKKEVGPATSRWQLSIYGFLEFDGMNDSTQSFSDSPGNSPLLRSDGSSPAFLPLGTNPYGVTYGSKHARMQGTGRNSRIGFKLTPPEYAGMKATGVLELDFFGNQPSNPPATSEGAFFASPTPRIRHAYAKIETDVVDVLFGQYYALFGWQPLFFPATDSFLGIPNMVFGRTPQIRVSKTIKTDPVDVQLAVAALRPPQRDAAMPDLQGGVRIGVNGVKGAHGSGSGQPTLDSLSFGISGALRSFRVAEFTNNVGDPTTATDVAAAHGFGYSVDAMIPVIPISNLDDRANALTLTGSFVQGQGIGDLFTGGLTGGVHFPLPEGPGGPNTGIYASNIDPGLVQYANYDPLNPDSKNVLRVIHWTAFMVGFQYYVPPAGKIVLSANYSRSKSDNIVNNTCLAPGQGGMPGVAGGPRQPCTLDQMIDLGDDPSRTFVQSDYYDANIFADITPAIRAGVSWQHVQQKFADDGKEKNDRYELSGFFFF